MRIPTWLTGEFFGTFLLVFFGCGAVASTLLSGAQASLFEIALLWGCGITTAIYLTGSLSGAHLNPAVTLSLALWSDFPKRRVLPYWAVQLCGAFAAAALLHCLFGATLANFESTRGIVRGAPGSEASAMVYGEYYPNPGGQPLTAEACAQVPALRAFGIEAAATAALLLVIFCVNDPRNGARPGILTAAAIGLTVSLLIFLFAPLTMGCFNPARDLGPRLFAATAGGWGGLPFSVNGWGWLTVYVLGPLVGGVVGGGLYRLVFRASYRGEEGAC